MASNIRYQRDLLLHGAAPTVPTSSTQIGQRWEQGSTPNTRPGAVPSALFPQIRLHLERIQWHDMYLVSLNNHTVSMPAYSVAYAVLLLLQKWENWSSPLLKRRHPLTILLHATATTCVADAFSLSCFRAASTHAALSAPAAYPYVPPPHRLPELVASREDHLLSLLLLMYIYACYMLSALGL
ncbi:hypothetical protein R3P38DRAFT_3287524 [Favolaschia claudopus]|uniref:Uncharacterized protein n=1 Tax=Favolaschia claudopus TaxID=2862362 RepID=A0AAV9ZZQ7_9AGAR